MADDGELPPGVIGAGGILGNMVPRPECIDLPSERSGRCAPRRPG
jgi:hypothetical protein